MSSTRLALLCLSGERPSFTLAATSENSLHIISIERPTADIAELKDMLDAKLPALADKGVTFFVDDPSGMFSSYGYKCSLSDSGYDGVGVLKKSLNRYFTLQKAGAITFPKNSHGFEIQPSIINERVKDSGEGYYQIDWPQLEDNARAALLLIHCAYSQTIQQTGFAKAMFSALDVIEGNQGGSPCDFINGLSKANQFQSPNESFANELRATGRRIL